MIDRSKYDPKGIAIACGLILSIFIISVLSTEKKPIQAISSTSTASTSSRPIYSGYTYQDLVISDVENAFLKSGGLASLDSRRKIDRDNGEECYGYDASGGFLHICSFNGKVSLIKYISKIDGTDSAKLGVLPITHGFMNTFAIGEYTKTDRMRIETSVFKYITEKRSLVEQIETNRLVAMGIHWVAIDNMGGSFEMIADPNIASQFDKAH